MTSINIWFLEALRVIGKKNAKVNEGTGNQGFTVVSSDNIFMTNEKTVNVKTLEKCFIEMIDKEKSNFVTMLTQSKTIQNAFLTATDIIITRIIELAIRSINW